MAYAALASLTEALSGILSCSDISLDSPTREIFQSICDEYEKIPKYSIPEDDDASASSNLDFGVEMVGYSSELTNLRSRLLVRTRPDDMCFSSILGEPGGGRTFVARSIFHDLCKGKQQRSFDCGAWVTVGASYELKEVVIRILAQVDDCEVLVSREDDDEKLRNHLQKVLKHRRYMIVLDDVRDVRVLDYLRRSFPDQSNGSLVMLTTSLSEVAQSTDKLHILEIPAPQEEEQRLCILSTLMVRQQSLTPEIFTALTEAASKIAENCGGRQISLAKTMLFLSQTESTPEQLSKIAADKQNPIFMIGDEISEICEIKIGMQSYNCIAEEDDDVSIIEWVSKVIDFSVYIDAIKGVIFPKRLFSRMEILSFVGMTGIGKTTYLKKVFKDKSILCHFDHRVWITLGPKYQADEILTDILTQIYLDIDKLHLLGDEKLAKELCAILSDKRCLIVLDDLRSIEPLKQLRKLLPDIKGTILVTTRTSSVGEYGGIEKYDLRMLNKEESWCLLRQKVFGKGLCPPRFEKVGRKIVEKCDGLPLLILTVANQLLEGEMTLEYWEDVASGKQKSVFKDAHDEISKALLPSYNILPRDLKVCFLYMGVFCENFEIPITKLTCLWNAEGYLESCPPEIDRQHLFTVHYLKELFDKSLVMVKTKASSRKAKSCRLHSVFWHLSNSEAVKENFFNAMNSFADCSIENINSQRICIRNNVLLGIENVRNLMTSLTSTESFLCVGSPHQYPVPIYFDLMLLKVMDALSIRLYEFPDEVVQLVHLRYLGLTCYGKLPASISRLLNLRYLIVSRYMNTQSSENSSLLPVEIWDMEELEHLQIMGGRLPNPECDASLPKLLTLLDVTVESCTEEVLTRIPNLKRLGIRIELTPHDEGNYQYPFQCLNNISLLGVLESLKCVVVNPEMGSEVVAQMPAPISMFPSSLKKLSLSGFGYPWEYMNIIGNLENLEVLKLKRYAFQGPNWNIDFTSPFSKLQLLLIEDTDLVHWDIKSPIFLKLERLSIKHCYQLQELPTYLPVFEFEKIEIVDCSPLTVAWAEGMGQRPVLFEVEAYLSWIVDSHKK